LIISGIFFIPKLLRPSEQVEKSIAVLPFINDSPSDSNKYFINGIMEEVLNNLMKIKDFRVLSRTSTDQYKGPDRPTMPEIAKKLGVNYIVEGSGQKFGNIFILRIQLIAAKNKEKHLWAERYEQEIKEVKDFIGIQSQIAHAIASELQAVITPEEKLLIKKTSTTNLTAYDFYQRGREEYVKYSTTGDREALKKAENLYHEALKYDSTFAQAYIGLATIYKIKHYWSDYFSKDFMDSVLILTNIALSYDNQSAEAYTIRGAYYSEIGKPELTLKEIDKAIKLNPNDWSSYLIKAQNSGNDLIKGIENYFKVLSLNRGSELPGYLRSISQLFLAAGFIDKAKYYLQEALKLDDDSLTYYLNLCSIETWSGDHIKGLEYAKKIYAVDSTNMDNLHLLGHLYMFLHQYEESLNYFKKYIESLRAKGNLNLLDMESLGFAYWQIGNKEEAESYFNREIDYCNKAINLGRSFGNIGAYYELADIYAIKGEKDKAFKNLRIFWQKQELVAITEQVIYVHILKNDPMFDNIRNEPEFQQIVRDVDAKCQAEHERVRKWLEDQGML
jgi:TolB-like protein/Tfp pilus assembly protein PilF